ncbi:hypothetical protein P0G11_12180, partial [Adlercreutzia rubneri]|uniref:hypothetical protein n=1 Tax=Adlercreutzia rubneri TaxID=2916441 RepID=UPI0023AF3DBD
GAADAGPLAEAWPRADRGPRLRESVGAFSEPAAPASARPTARSERRANNLAKGDAARVRLAAKRAARAAKREEGR